MRVYPQRKTTGRGPLFSVRPDFFAGQSIISSPDFSVPCPHKEIGFVAFKILAERRACSPPRAGSHSTGRFESPETESLPPSIDVRQILDFDL